MYEVQPADMVLPEVPLALRHNLSTVLPNINLGKKNTLSIYTIYSVNNTHRIQYIYKSATG